MPDSAAYALRPMTAADLPLVALWLRGPDLVDWWGDPAEQLALVTEDLGAPLLDQQIATHEGEPIGYLQSYPFDAWPAGAPHLADQPPGAHAIDGFTAPGHTGQGHGRVILRLYAETLLARGIPAVVIDPDPSNERAVRAYRRAGFRDVARRVDGEGDMTLVMRYDPTAISV